MVKNQENASSCCSQGRHRTLSALISLSLAGALGVTTIGCSGESIAEVTTEEATQGTGSNDAAENALIEAHLEGRGYDTSTVRFEGDAVVVEGDMVMSRDLLLEQAEAEATGVVEKGYFLGTTLFSGKRIQLSFANNVSTAWRNALNAARNEWNNKTPRFSRDPGSAATINVVLGSLASNLFAQGTFPPSRTITLNSSFTDASCGGSLENIPTNVKAKIAMHEIGHVLGFDHPPPNTASGSTRVHIAGTTANTGLLEPSYATVMATGCFTRTTLSSDDVTSAGKKYPSCIATCETNCQSLLDPGSIGLCMAACPQQCGG
jgi:hypothetical protein